MQLSNAPGKLVLPFAASGAKNAIPVASQIGIVAGAASLTDGFPPLTRTPLAAGGVPPSGLDMNGIIYELSAILRWTNAGAGYVYDGTFATDSNVGGYPKGARILRSDGAGYWLNTIDGNTVDPEGAGAVAAGWVPDFTNGVAAVTMTGSNVTLTPLQYGKPIIVITGTLTANLNLIFPSIAGEWSVINNTTGAYSITCKTAAGTGVVAPQAGATIIYGDATNIGYAFTRIQTPAQFANDTNLATTAFVRSEILGQGNAVYDAIFGKSLTASGYQKLPSGLIIQWGLLSVTVVGGTNISVPVTFPITFPGSLFTVMTDIETESPGQVSSSPLSQTAGGFTLKAWSATTSGSTAAFWIALGK